jgi:hypothetical protein
VKSKSVTRETPVLQRRQTLSGGRVYPLKLELESELVYGGFEAGG